MILFGSYAKGKVHKYSDVDLAVWNEKFSGIGLEDFEQIKFIKRQYPIVNLKTYPSGATAENDDPFIEVIEKTGIQIFP